MIWFVKRDRALETFAEAIRPELAALRTPPPSAELRDRILADRATGARVILPAERTLRRPMAPYLLAAVLVVAAVLALPFYRQTKDDARDAEPTSPLSYLGGGGVARAQEPPPIEWRLPAALPARAERVHAGTLEYLRSWSDSSGRVVRRATSVLTVSAETAATIPAWRVVEIGRDSVAGGTTAETLLVAQRDLRLLARAVHVRPYRKWNGINIQQRLTGDSVNGRMTLDDVQGMRRIARRLPPAYAPYVADLFSPIYLAAVPLDRQWTGRVMVLGWAVVPKDVFYPVELRVTGEQLLTVPAGRFDCWTLSIRYPGGVLESWIRKSDGIALRVVERRRNGHERVVTLVREAGL